MSPTELHPRNFTRRFDDVAVPEAQEAPEATPSSPFDRGEKYSSAAVFSPKGILALLILLAGTVMQLFYFMGVGFNRVNDSIPWLLPLNAGLLLVICLMQPILLFCLIISYFPFSNAGIDVELGIVTLNPYSLGVMFMLPIAFINKAVHPRSLPIHSSDLFLILACMFLLVSTLLGEQVVRGGFIAFNSIFIPVLAMIVIRMMVSNEMQYGLLVRVLLLSVLAFGVLAIGYFLQTGLRAMPMNTRPISAASCLMLAIFYYALGKYYPRIFRITACLFCLAGFAVTFSRVFTLVMLLSPLMYLAIKRGKAFWMFVGFFAGTLLLTVGLVLSADSLRPPHYAPKEGMYKSSDRLTDEADISLSLYGRILTYKQGLQTFMDNPIFGTGPAPSFLATGTTQHNFTVEWLEYGGLSGYTLFVLFFLMHVRRIAPLARHDLYMRINLLALIAVLCNSFFNGIMHGFMPNVAYTVIGLNEARYPFVKKRLEAEQAKAEEEERINELRHEAAERRRNRWRKLA